MGKTIVIVGSANQRGNSYTIGNGIAEKNGYDMINLMEKNINHFSYTGENSDDDFLPIIKNIIENYDTLLFVTPVYWYSMSGHMKVFLDRFSVLLISEKELGRQLRGKKMGIISNSGDASLDYDFGIVFRKTAEYLGMEYLGHKHYNQETFKQEEVFTF